MVTLSSTVVLKLHAADSLKDKRQVVRSVCERVRRRFNVAIAEVDGQDTWNLAMLGIVTVSNERQHAEEVLDQVVRFIERERPDLDVVEYELS